MKEETLKGRERGRNGARATSTARRRCIALVGDRIASRRAASSSPAPSSRVAFVCPVLSSCASIVRIVVVVIVTVARRGRSRSHSPCPSVRDNALALVVDTSSAISRGERRRRGRRRWCMQPVVFSRHAPHRLTRSRAVSGDLATCGIRRAGGRPNLALAADLGNAPARRRW